MDFTTLLLLEDLTPRSAGVQMALDELLLQSATRPILHVYRWANPCVTIGYFESWEAATLAFPGAELMRRWTGGGTVLHGADWPYSLIVPRTEPLAQLRPSASYHRIHAALLRSLEKPYPSLTLASESAPKTSSACFQNPVQSDLLLEGKKVAGAGQKRSRNGFLHQGSVQLGPAQRPDALRFARALAARTEILPLRESLLAEAQGLAKERYETHAWLHAR